GIEEDVPSPDSLDDPVPPDELALLFDQEAQDLHGDALELEGASAAAQLVRPRVELEAVAEADVLGRLGRLRRHGRPQETAPAILQPAARPWTTRPLPGACGFIWLKEFFMLPPWPMAGVANSFSISPARRQRKKPWRSRCL